MEASPLPEWILAARIVRPRGIRGEVIAELRAAGVTESLGRAAFELRRDNEAPSPVRIESSWVHRDRLVLKIAGVDTIEQAEQLRGGQLWMRRADRVPAPEGACYTDELIGCLVFERPSGQLLGKVTDCLDYGGPLLLEVTAGEREILIPFVPEICVEKDIVARRLVVVLPEGLKEL
ncbi:MAG: ribosome maturation factor RimM [Bryobacteraceae bacterium]|nr:ribosome maturation factor RimM [Bryobacteraceae bacterium]MDW8379705.1 ribosome maturation factor RimM [Bryobacterales bacterium]